jgi:hypothetical protein
MKSDRVLIILAFGIILARLLSVNAVWATPEQSGNRQTVPTFTPKGSTPVPPPEKEKDTPTPVPPTATVTPTRLPATLRPTGILTASSSLTLTATPVPATATATATELPRATDTVVPPTQTVAPPSASNTPAVAAALPTVVATATVSTTTTGSNWLLWGIGLILIVGGAVLVFVRPGKKSA